MGLRVGGERFKLEEVVSDGDDSSDQWDPKAIWEEWSETYRDSFEEGKAASRKWNKVNYSEREVKLWLALGLIEMHEIVELWLDGVIKFAVEIVWSVV